VMLNVPDRDLPQVLQDVGDEIAFQLVMNRPLLESMRRSATGARAKTAASSPLRRQFAKAGVSSRLRRQLAR